jgi:hypothetical protein
MRVDTKVAPVSNRTYVILYAGPEGSNSGMPVAIFDPQAGTTYEVTRHFQAHYKENVSTWGWFGSWVPLVAGAIALFNGIPTLLLLFVGSFSGFLAGALMSAAGVGLVKWGWSLRKRYQGGRKEALRRAGEFIGRHGRDLVVEG